MEITSYSFCDGTLRVRVQDAEGGWSSRVVVRENSRHISGSTLAGSRHSRICQALSIAFQQMIRGENIDETNTF